MSARRDQIREKVLARVQVDPVTGCWNWTGPTSGERGRGKGYPRMSLSGQTVAVHLVMWTNEHGFIPGKKQLDHKCRNRRCVNPHPDHTELVTHRENMRRRDRFACREVSTSITNANDERWNWINAFCTDFADDTFNRAVKLGFIRVTHNDLTDDSTARLTDAGQAFISYFTEIPSAALARQAEAMKREMAELRALLSRAEEYIIDGVTNAKADAEMNAAYPTRATRYNAALEEVRQLHADVSRALIGGGNAED